MSDHRPRHLVLLLTVGAALILSACADGTGADDGTESATTTTTTTPTTTPTPPPPVSPAPTTTATATSTATSTPIATATTTTATTVPTADDCDPSEFRSEFTDPVVLFCDGSWARAGQAQTDHVMLFRSRDGQWQAHPHDGRSEITEYICYDEDKLRDADAPEELISQVLLCQSGD